MARSASRTIVLTGATRGLGRALALAFSEQGHTVLGCGRDVRSVARLAGELGDSHHVASVDVADPEGVSTWASTLLERFGPPHLLINNAAIINPNAHLWEVPPAELQAVLNVNLAGPCHTIRAFVPAMIEAGRGVIVNFSSYWGRSVAAEVAPYCASKWGIEGLTRALAQELPRGLAAVAFNPGVIDTDLLRSTFGEAAAHYPDPADWARSAAPYLLGLGPLQNGRSVTAPGQ